MNDETHSDVGARTAFLTARQLAAHLQVSETTVHRLAREGRIPAVRLTPRLVRFHLPTVLEALDGQAGRHKRRNAARPAPAEHEQAQLSFDELT